MLGGIRSQEGKESRIRGYREMRVAVLNRAVSDEENTQTEKDKAQEI